MLNVTSECILTDLSLSVKRVSGDSKDMKQSAKHGVQGQIVTGSGFMCDGGCWNLLDSEDLYSVQVLSFYYLEWQQRMQRNTFTEICVSKHFMPLEL